MEILSSLVKTTQLGQSGIRSVLDICAGPSLKKTLEAQLREYDWIESEAYALASQRGWDLYDLDPARRFVSDRLLRMRLVRGKSDSRIADITIRENTKGMIRELKNLHRYPGPEDPVRLLSRRLLDCQQANIHAMQEFL